MARADNLERSWATVSAIAISLGAFLVILAIPTKGLGIIYQGNRFILRQGPYWAKIDQVLGIAYSILTAVSILAVTIAVILGGLIYLKHGSLDLSQVLDSRGLTHHAWAIRISGLVLLAAFLALALSTM
jgi:hypothetical protein